jgi:chromosome segregation ATPase
MSTSYLRPSRSATKSTPVSTTKAKRKSGDRDDMENRSPNRDEDDEVTKSAKKSRFFGSKTEDPPKKSQVASRIRSALPRYNSSSVAETKKRQVTERMTAERSEATPTRSAGGSSSSAVKSPRPSVAGSVKRRGRQSLSKVTRGRIKSLFDKVNLQDEDKINELIAPKLKVKCKWDYKDKAKRQTEVINDLKTVLKDTIQEFKSVKTDCEDAEQSMDELIHQLRIDLQDSEQKNGDLKKSESKLKKDYIRVSNDYNSCRSQLRALEEEVEPLREKSAAKKKEVDDLRADIESKIDLLASYELEVKDLKETLKLLSNEKAELTKSFQDLVDEVCRHDFIM